MSAGNTTRAAILGGNRIPFARRDREYSQASNQDMLTAALNGLVSRFGLQGERIGEVAAGAVLKRSRDFTLTRECVLGSARAPETPAYDVQQACGTGLETTIHVANKVALGQIKSGVAGGADTTSDAPIELNEDLRRLLLDLNRTRPTAGRLALLRPLRPGQAVPAIPQNAEPRTGLSMGEHQAISTKCWGISRRAQDDYAVESHRRLAAAYDRGFFADLLTPFLGLERDGNLRPDASVEKLARLEPVFGDGAGATMTAGNSTPLSDGASTVLLASDAWAEQRSLPVLAHLVDAETGAVDFVHGDEGLLAAPLYAVPRLLERNDLGLGDFDFYEIHEAFASQVLMTLKAWEDPAFCAERLGREEPLGWIDRAKLNVNGSSLAAGHPFGATGARIVATLAKLLAERGSGRGLISICAAGGQGVAAILERSA